LRAFFIGLPSRKGNSLLLGLLFGLSTACSGLCSRRHARTQRQALLFEIMLRAALWVIVGYATHRFGQSMQLAANSRMAADILSAALFLILQLFVLVFGLTSKSKAADRKSAPHGDPLQRGWHL